MDIQVLLLALLGLLGLGYLYQRSLSNKASALNENLETKEKVMDVEKKETSLDEKLHTEEETRKKIEEDANKEKNNELSPDDLADFFNKRSSH